jgi:PilZ domain
MRGGNLRLSDFDGPERRSRTRFPIELGAHYTVDGGNDISATGQTVNISSNGVLITSAHEVSPDTSIRVVIEWPVLLGDVCPVALHVHGRVVRSDHGVVAVQYSRHELRTQPKPPGQVQGTPSKKPLGMPSLGRR